MRSRRVFGLVLVLVAAAALATPVKAGSLTYTDPGGDATAVDNYDPPRPSDPELDILEVAWSTTAEELVITTTLETIGEPIASNGWAVAHYLDYEGIRFEILVQDVGTPSDAVFGDGVYLRRAGDSSTEYPCVCRTFSEPETAQVHVFVELHSLGSAARFVDPRIRRPGPGAIFSDLETVSYRILGALFASDRAEPAPDTNFVV
ncbi:MAG: hypothetical protein KY395_07305 [Actinobacteria bacterium]|nr:hypothetical protein [Actinomycetota bacterium]